MIDRTKYPITPYEMVAVLKAVADQVGAATAKRQVIGDVRPEVLKAAAKYIVENEREKALGKRAA